MSRLRMSGRQKAALAAALAVLLWLPSGVSHEEGTIITGHSTFYNGQGYDKCLGSIAGIIRSRVMWFNDQVLAERYSGKGTFMYVTEAGSRDPRGATLYSEGVFYDFVDPNGAHWHIEESFMMHTFGQYANVNTEPTSNSAPLVDAGLGANRTYVWTVELSERPIFDQFAGADPHTFYNFLTLVDTCKFHTYTPNRVESHDTPAELNDQNGHPNGETAHDHQAWLVNLWVGTRPTAIPAGVSTDGAEWQSQWALTEYEQQAEQNDLPNPEQVPEPEAP